MSSPAVQLRTRVPRLAEAAAERARLTLVPRRRTRAARVPFVMLVSLVLLGGVVGLLLFNTSMQQASFAASSLEERATTLAAREQTLKMELDVLRNPQRVAEQAQEMGMVPAKNPAFLRLVDGKVLGAPAVATAADGLRIRPRPPVKPAVLSPEPIIETVVVETVPGTSASEADGGSGRGTDGARGSRHARNGR
jgi:hypothetical protein